MTNVGTKQHATQTKSGSTLWVDAQLLGPIEYVNIETLERYPRRLRRAIKRQIKKYEEFVGACGLVTPILVDHQGTIIFGLELFEAARALGYTKVPIVRVEHLTPAQVRMVRLALYRLPELGEWNREALAIELGELLEIEFDVEVSGFDLPEIDILLDDQLLPAANSPLDETPNTENTVISRVGDIWLLDEHVVGCGDARDPDAYEAILDGRRARMVITDSPWNLKVDGNICGKGATKHDEFVMASGEMSEQEFEIFNVAWVRNLIRFSADGSVHYLFMDWRHLYDLEGVCRQHYDKHLNTCVWVKSNGGMGSHYRSRHEFVLVYRNGKKSHTNNVKLGQYGRNRTNLWPYDGVNTFSGERRADLALHPTTKPVAMIADAIRDSSHRGDLILDPFLGSGTTVIACEETGRTCVGFELDPKYVDVIVRRWEKFTAHEAVHAVTGMTFAEMADMRTGKVLLLPPPDGEET